MRERGSCYKTSRSSGSGRQLDVLHTQCEMQCSSSRVAGACRARSIMQSTTTCRRRRVASRAKHAAGRERVGFSPGCERVAFRGRRCCKACSSTRFTTTSCGRSRGSSDRWRDAANVSTTQRRCAPTRPRLREMGQGATHCVGRSGRKVGNASSGRSGMARCSVPQSVAQLNSRCVYRSVHQGAWRPSV